MSSIKSYQRLTFFSSSTVFSSTTSAQISINSFASLPRTVLRKVCSSLILFLSRLILEFFMRRFFDRAVILCVDWESINLLTRGFSQLLAEHVYFYFGKGVQLPPLVDVCEEENLLQPTSQINRRII